MRIILSELPGLSRSVRQLTIPAETHDLYLMELETAIRLLEQAQREKWSTYEGLKTDHLLGAPASTTDLKNLTTYFGNRLPKDYLRLLSIHNGATIFRFEDIGGFQLLSAEELIAEDQFQQENLAADWDDAIVLFCEVLGEGNHLGFKRGKAGGYEILDCFHEVLPSEWRSIGVDLSQFLHTLLAGRGRMFWL